MTQDIPSLKDAVLNGVDWRMIGPHRGGRVVAVAGDVRDPMTFYFGACAGGIWKTVDGGLNWRNISDGFLGTAAIGSLAVSESDPNVIFAGTGETSIRGNVSHGDGIYRSLDAGRTWKNVGLPDSRHIGKIQIHPTNPDIVYAAALGHAYGPNEERGVFRSTDGGDSWERVLFVNNTAGSHDVSLDPNNPRMLFASIWQVQRYPHTLVSGGPLSGLWRSSDGGDNWEEITRNPGLLKGMLGKTGVAVSRAKQGRVWVLIEAEDGAMFRSDDWGERWVRLSEESLLRTRPWYYMHVTADTTDADTVYVQNYALWRSIDGGANFVKMPTPHGDDHALWIDPVDHNRMIEGNDGGANVSFNAGVSWSSIYNQPTAQLYHVTTDDQFPYRVYGSQQDNTAISVPSATTDNSIHERSWFIPGGGESGYIAIKPDEPWHIVASGPVGRRNYNDIMTHYDHRTGQIRDITVWPELFGWGAGAESLKYRLQWTFPILFSKHAPHDLFVAGNRLFRSSDLGSSFEVVSPDLTRNDPDKLRPSGGPITRDNTSAEVYCTIFALAEAATTPGVMWAGSDDGLVHRSVDFGKTWTNVTPPDLPEWALISIIEASPHDDATAYIAATRYRLDDWTPYLYKTDDDGATWTRISDSFPDGEITRVIREDPVEQGLLYAGTETGLFVSFDDGASWNRLGGHFPVVPVYDLVIKGDEMVVATHGRSFWILDDLTPLRQLRRLPLARSEVELFTPRPRVRLRTYRGWKPMDTEGVVNFAYAGPSQTHFDPVIRADGTLERRHLDAGENPPDGVVVRYFLPNEPQGEVTLTFLDANGTEIRAYSSDCDKPETRISKTAGFNRFVWNTRHPGATSVKHAGMTTWDRPDGALILPGKHRVRLSVDGETFETSFELLPDPRIETAMRDLKAQESFSIELVALLTRINRTIDQLANLKDQVSFWLERTDDPKIAELGNEVIERVDEILPKLIDVNMAQSQLWPSGLHEKINALIDSTDGADYAPPAQALEVYGELAEELDEITGALASLDRGPMEAFREAVGGANMLPIELGS